MTNASVHTASAHVNQVNSTNSRPNAHRLTEHAPPTPMLYVPNCGDTSKRFGSSRATVRAGGNALGAVQFCGSWYAIMYGQPSLDVLPVSHVSFGYSCQPCICARHNMHTSCIEEMGFAKGILRIVVSHCTMGTFSKDRHPSIPSMTRRKLDDEHESLPR